MFDCGRAGNLGVIYGDSWTRSMSKSKSSVDRFRLIYFEPPFCIIDFHKSLTILKME